MEWVRSTPVGELVATYRSTMAWQAQLEINNFTAGRMAGASEVEPIEKYIKAKEIIRDE